MPHRWPSSSSRCSPWRGGSSSPSGLRVCTSSYVFDLSLSCSLSCSLYGTILMYPELCYCSWILWCFSPSTLLWWIEFPLWSYLIGLSLLWEHLMYVLPCLSVVTMGYHVPLDVCFGDQLAGSAHEPMHRGWHTFSLLFSGRNFGALFEGLCVGWIDELRLCDAYRIIMPTDTWGDNGVSRRH